MARLIILLLSFAILYAIYKYHEQYESQYQVHQSSKGDDNKHNEATYDDLSLGSLDDADFCDLGSLIETNDVDSNDSLYDGKN